MAQDLLNRPYTPNPLTDLNDPPRFPLLLEAVKDAFVERLRAFFAKATTTAARRAEAVTIRKYATSAPGANEDPYLTYTTLVQEFSDLTERLPHVAVLGATGSEKTFSVGRPLLATVQDPPRITSTTGPFAIPAAVAAVQRVTITGNGAATVAVDGEAVTVTVSGGDLVAGAEALAEALRVSSIGLRFRVELSATSPAVTLTAREVGVPFTIAVVGPVVPTVVTAAGSATGEAALCIRTRYGDEQLRLVPWMFSTAAPITAATAAATATALTGQTPHVGFTAVTSGAGTALELRCLDSTPNEVEVIPIATADADSDAAVGGAAVEAAFALGLAVGGTLPSGSTFTLSPTADGQATLAAGSGTPFSGLTPGTNGVTRYLTLAAGSATPTGATVRNAGRWRILTVGGGGATVTFDLDEPEAAAAAASGTDRLPPEAGAMTTGTTWFSGLRDDWFNTTRPVKHRYVGPAADLTVTLEIYAEDPPSRLELHGLVWSAIAVFAEETHFTWYGRSVLNEATPGEHLQISLNRQANAGGDQDFPRSGDEKVRTYQTRISVPITAVWYLDREVLVPSGPRVGQSFALRAGDVEPEPGA